MEETYCDFRTMKSWMAAIAAQAIIFPLLGKIRGPGAKDMADQIARSLDSIHANIAEGYGKGLCADNIRFQKIAMASCCEAETRLEALVRSGRLAHPNAQLGIDKLRECRAMIRGYIKWLQRRIDETKL